MANSDADWMQSSRIMNINEMGVEIRISANLTDRQ